MGSLGASDHIHLSLCVQMLWLDDSFARAVLGERYGVDIEHIGQKALKPGSVVSLEKAVTIQLPIAAPFFVLLFLSVFGLVLPGMGDSQSTPQGHLEEACGGPFVFVVVLVVVINLSQKPLAFTLPRTNTHTHTGMSS